MTDLDVGNLIIVIVWLGSIKPKNSYRKYMKPFFNFICADIRDNSIIANIAIYPNRYTFDLETAFL